MNKLNNQILFSIIVILSLLLGIFNQDFASIENIYDLLNNYSMLIIFACGLLVVLISGGIDISFPAISIIAQYITISLLAQYDLGFLGLFSISALVGVGLGILNAILVYQLKAPSIIITISTLNIFYGALFYFSKGVWLFDYPQWFQQEIIFFKITNAEDLSYGLSFQIILSIIAVALTGILINKLSIGRQIYALGGNAEAASRLGFSLFKLQLFTYGYMGFMAALAGIAQAYTVQSVAPNSLLGYELTVLAAVVLGGASLSGGTGSLLGTMMGVALLAIIQNGLNLLNISSYWQTVITGIIIIFSISASALGQRKLAQ